MQRHRPDRRCQATISRGVAHHARPHRELRASSLIPRPARSTSRRCCRGMRHRCCIRSASPQIAAANVHGHRPRPSLERHVYDPKLGDSRTHAEHRAVRSRRPISTSGGDRMGGGRQADHKIRLRKGSASPVQGSGAAAITSAIADAPAGICSTDAGLARHDPQVISTTGPQAHKPLQINYGLREHRHDHQDVILHSSCITDTAARCFRFARPLRKDPGRWRAATTACLVQGPYLNGRSRDRHFGAFAELKGIRETADGVEIGALETADHRSSATRSSSQGTRAG